MNSKPSGDDPLAHVDRSVELNTTPERVWQVLTSPDKWELFYGAIREIRPGWIEGAQVHWENGTSSTIGAVRLLEELRLFDATGTWLTWRLLPIGNNRVQVTLLEDRRTPLTVAAAFERHEEMHSILGRLRSVIEPQIAPQWELHLADGGDTGSTHGPVRLGKTLIAVTGRFLHGVDVNGKIKWSFLTEWDDHPHGLPSACSDLVIFNSLEGKVLALDAETGNLQWKRSIGGDLNWPPAFGGGRVFVVKHERRPAGSVIDVLEAKSGEFVWSRKLPGYLGPLVEWNGQLYAAGPSQYGKDPLVVALDASSGDTHWSAVIWTAEFVPPVVAAGSVYLSTSSGLVALDAESGGTQWSVDFFEGSKSAPAVVCGKMYVRTSDHGVCCIDSETRRVDWRYAVNSKLSDYRHPSSPIVVDGVVYCDLGDLHIHAVDANSGGLLWSCPVGLERPEVGSPVVVEGALYFLDYRRLFALNLHVNKFG